MTQTLSSSPNLQSSLQPQPSGNQTRLKWISFALPQTQLATVPTAQALYFGVSIQQVQRILHQPAVYRSGVTAVGVTTLAGQEVTIVDLHQLVYGKPLHEANYLVVLSVPGHGWFGIPTPASPSLVELAPEQLRHLPAAYRQMDTLGIANQIGITQLEDTLGDSQQTQAIFLLDLPRMVATLLTA